jgi:lysozyme family protein
VTIVANDVMPAIKAWAAAPIVPVPVVVSVPSGDFDKAFAFVIQWEGGYSNDAGDSGGPTMYGIDTKDDSAAWRALGVTDVRNLTLAQAKGIYREKYWLKALCDQMPSPVAETHFNYAVNVGAFQSVKFMQRALGISPVDGDFGPITQAALKAAIPLKVAQGMIDAADMFYKELGAGNDGKFLQGWLHRNADLRKFVIA